jgi:hypothetical membrane protein
MRAFGWWPACTAMAIDSRVDSAPRLAEPLAPTARTSLLLAIVGIVLYIVLDIIAQLLPPHYSPISQGESDLAVGPYGYVMTVNFVIRGLLTFAFLVGLSGATRLGKYARVGLALLAVWGAGAFVLAAFPTDVGTVVTVHGTIHNLTALVAFTGGAFGTLALSLHFRAEERLRRLDAAARLIAVLGVVMYFATASALFIRRLSHIFGLVERLFIGLVLLWMLVVAIQLLRSNRSASVASPA